MDAQTMRDYIGNFSLDNGPLGNQGYSRVLLQLFGFTGHGKSSFINSCKYVLDDGPYTAHAKVAESDKDPETMIRKAYEMTETITLVDNRGCVKMNKDETGEIYAQLGNFLPLEKEVKWQKNFKDMMEIILTAETQEQNGDFIVPVLIYSAKKTITSAEAEELAEIILKARDITGLVPTVVITCKRSEHLPDVLEKFRRMGVDNIFPVENYTAEDPLKTRGKHEGILKCLYEIMRDVEFRMKEPRNPSAEKIERKRILLEFAHKRDLEKEKQREYREREEAQKREAIECARKKEAQEREARERARREELERELECNKGVWGWVKSKFPF